MKPRMLVWFSCGSPSAMAAKLALTHHSQDYDVAVVNCDTKPSEHPDNYRFFNDVQNWLGVKIIEIRSEDYTTVEEVADKTRYMSGPRGARCTTELKKIPRLKFATPEDVHVFGMARDEKDRISKFEERNPDMILRWLLLEHGLTTQDCRNSIESAGIKQPMMYRLGFDNNNCPGCFKGASAWYWDKVRTIFPEVFKRRCLQSRELGCRLIDVNNEVVSRLPESLKDNDRIFLDELPPGPYKKHKKERMSCGPECGIQLPLFQ